jgi:hypothetical protein
MILEFNDIRRMKLDLQQRAITIKKAISLAILCMVIAPFFTAIKVDAQTQSNVTITAQAGLDGFCKVDKWLPVHVTVENTGKDITARVQTSYKNNSDGQTVDGMDISLPSTSRKEFFLYVTPQAFMRSFSVSVLDGKKVLAKTNLNISCSSDPTMLFGLLADKPSTYAVLNNIHPASGLTRTAQLNISDLPDRAQGWEMLDALIISNVDTGTLTPGQKQALELWLANGGKLFVTGGIQWQTTTAGLSEFLPIKPTSSQNVSDLSALSTYAKYPNPLTSNVILTTGTVQKGSNTLVKQNNISLLIEKQIGYGKVYYFAADPGLQPLNDWVGMQYIYEHLLAYKSPKPSWASGSFEPNQAKTALSTLPELSLPSFIYICCWLGLYIGVIGPVNYFILRRIKRTELAWVTVPILVVIFTSLAYFSGYLYRGTRPILNRIMLAQAWQGVDQAQTTALVGLYSPTRTTYYVESQDQFLIFPYPDMNEDLQGNHDWLSIKNDAGVTLPDVRVEIGGMQSLAMDGALVPLAIQHNLTLTLTNNIPVLKGAITNTSNYTLKDATLITPSGWNIIGDMAPHESKDISTTLINNSSTSAIGQYTILTALGLDTYSDDIDKKRHASFFQAVTASPKSLINVNAGIYLMGWVDNKIPAPASLQKQNIDATDTLLYFEKLTPALETESGVLMLTSSIYSWNSSLGDTITTTNYDLVDGKYDIHFQPSLPIHFSKVDSLTLSIVSNSAPDKAQTSLWNFETKNWDHITLNTYDTEIPKAAQYVGMDGEIIMSISGNQNDYFEITSIDFILMVRP